MILLSACLAGIPCRYDGSAAPEPMAVKLFQAGEGIALCPEELGGLPTPRPDAEFCGGAGEDVLDGKAQILRGNGEDVTECFIAGAGAVLRIVKDLGLSEAVFKARSPACGRGKVYCGGKLVTGNGVCTALLLRHGCKVRVKGI